MKLKNLYIGLLTIIISIGSYAQVSEIEKEALKAFYDATNGDKWTNTIEGNGVWDFKTPVTSYNSETKKGWYGISVVDGHVDVIGSSANNLNGSFPKEFGNLSYLRYLKITNSPNLVGPIPEEIGKLKSLQYFYVYSNGLSGTVPSQIGELTNLRHLRLNSNNLSGSLPTSIGNLKNLEVLNFISNNLSGSIPAEFGNLSSLKELYLIGNSLTGFIPKEIGQLSKLTKIWLDTNQLSGPIPEEFGNLLSLESLQLSGNQLTGELPSSIGNLPNLKVIALYTNKITGEIPSSYGNLTGLTQLHLRDNLLSGTIPQSLGDLQNLGLVFINRNNFSGPLPFSLKSNPLLSRLQIEGNGFVFNDFENQHAQFVSEVGVYTYTPQDKVDETEAITLPQGNSVTLTTEDLTSANNTYQWYKDNVAIIGATEKNFVISNANEGDAGVYHFVATNNIVTGLTLERNPITISIGPAINPCEKETIKAEDALTLLINHLINKVREGGANEIPSPYYPNEMEALSQFLDVESPAIYNFKFLEPDGENPPRIQFSFGPKSCYQVIELEWDECKFKEFEVAALVDVAGIQFTENLDGYQLIYKNISCRRVIGKDEHLSPYVEKFSCLKICNSCKPIVGGIKINTSRYCVGSDLGFRFEQIGSTQIDSYAWTFYDTDGTTVLSTSALAQPIYNYTTSGNYGVKLLITYADKCTEEFNRTTSILDCIQPCDGSDEVEDIFNSLLQDLVTRVQAGETSADINGTSSTYLTALLPYLTDIDANGVINNFTMVQSGDFKFSFSPNHVNDVEFYAGIGLTGLDLSGMDLDFMNYGGPDDYTQFSDFYVPSGDYVKLIKVRHVDFCSETDNTISCESHINFNFKFSNAGSITNAMQENLANGIISFVNATLEDDVLISTYDDHSAGARHTAIQQNYDTPFPDATTNGSNETQGGFFRIQNDYYTNSFKNIADKIVNEPNINVPINISFFIISHDKFNTDLPTVKAAYDDLLATKANKVFFIFLEDGFVTDQLNSQNLTPFNFIEALKGGSPINYDLTNSILNSDYITYSRNEVASINFKNQLSSFLLGAYNEIQAEDCDGGDCELDPWTIQATSCSPLLKKEESSTNRLETYCAEECYQFSLSTTSPVTSYSWVIYNEDGSELESITGSDLIQVTFPSNGTYNLNLSIAYGDGNCTEELSKIINVIDCSNTGCTETNENSIVIQDLYLDLINRLIDEYQTTGDISTNNPTELQELAHYITDENPRIYNFTYNNSGTNEYTFSFSEDHEGYDVKVVRVDGQGDLGDVVEDMSNINFAATSNYAMHTLDWGNGITTIGSETRHIDFCPDELIDPCEIHVAIVVDESGSISEEEAQQIRTGLYNYIESELGSQTQVSITGMSDSDNNLRTDNIGPAYVNSTTKSNLFDPWIAGFGNRNGNPGVSGSSDYWASALKVVNAFEYKPKIVIIFTDGSQTADVDGLKAEINDVRQSSNIYVYGIDNEYYVNGNNASSRLSRDQDPNFTQQPKSNRNTFSNTSSARNVIPSLRTSLDFLFGDAVPEGVPVDGVTRLLEVDYHGYEDFLGFSTGDTTLYNILARSSIGCGTPFELCYDCYSFQPEPGKNYWISGWVKEDLNIQVSTYANSSIKVIFLDNIDNVISTDVSTTFIPSGDIIEGWQRIASKFTIPNETVTMSIELINNSPNIPVYFDDIRVHPLNGSMKSFVYDPITYRLMAELDENNYGTYYEYDNEGGLVRVKKETSKGIKTIQETRSGNVIKTNQE